MRASKGSVKAEGKRFEVDEVWVKSTYRRNTFAEWIARTCILKIKKCLVRILVAVACGYCGDT